MAHQLDFLISRFPRTFGLYFALEHFPIDSGVETDVCAALWAINYVSCKGIALGTPFPSAGKERESRGKARRADHFPEVFLEDHQEYFVAPLRPQRHNERQSVQQALFRCRFRWSFRLRSYSYSQRTFTQPWGTLSEAAISPTMKSFARIFSGWYDTLNLRRKEPGRLSQNFNA